MRGDLSLKFLELISEFGGNLEDHLVGFLKAGYGASASTMEYETSKHRRKRERRKAEVEEEQRLRQRYYVMKSSLKKDGLISDIQSGERKGLILTPQGHFKLKQLKNSAASYLAVPGYKLEFGTRVIIVAFDIPEEERHKRAWLRSVLKNFGMKIVQQSVWVGKGVLPKEFLDDLDKMGLVDFVEIFEVTKSGSLMHVL